MFLRRQGVIMDPMLIKGHLFELWMTVIGFTMALSGLPQIVRIIRRKSSEDVSYLLWLIILHGQIWWGIYGWWKQSPSLFWTNVVTGISSLSILIATWYYRRRGRRTIKDRVKERSSIFLDP